MKAPESDQHKRNGQNLGLYFEYSSCWKNVVDELNDLIWLLRCDYKNKKKDVYYRRLWHQYKALQQSPKLRRRKSSSVISLKCFGTLALKGLCNYKNDVNVQEFQEVHIGEHPVKLLDVMLQDVLLIARNILNVFPFRTHQFHPGSRLGCQYKATQTQLSNSHSGKVEV